MASQSQIAFLRIHRLSIPLRRPFRHAASERAVAEPVVVAVELGDGTVGYGETLPRPYVSGETIETVVAAVRDVFISELLSFRPERFAEALERIDALPTHTEQGRVITAARAAVELALLDAYSRHFGRPITEAVGWLGVAPFEPPKTGTQLVSREDAKGALRKRAASPFSEPRYSGVLSAESPQRLRRAVRRMWWYGLRDFKLKVGYPDDGERIDAVAAALGGSLGHGTTLRLDANGAWELERAIEVLECLGERAVTWIEQPLPRVNDRALSELKRYVDVSIMHDESLITMRDAERLVDMGVADGFNVRLSKNGGFIAGLHLAHLARKHGAACQLGCMVGETSILSAAGRRFLECVPTVTFVEGAYGRFLMRGDVVDRPVQIRCGGRVPARPGLGWGIDVREDRLSEFGVVPCDEIVL